MLSTPPQVSETFLNSFIEILSEKHNLTLYVSRKSDNKLPNISQKKFIRKDFSSLLKTFEILALLFFNLKRYRNLRKLNVSTKQLIADIHIWTSRNLDYLHFGFGNLILGREYYGQVIGCKTSISFRGSDINVYPIWHGKSYGLALNLVNKIQANSLELVDKLKLHASGIQNKSVVIHPGLQKTFNANNDEINFYFEKRNQNEITHIVSIGRLHWVKGYEITLLALSLFKKRGSNFRYTIIGSGAESEKLNYLLDFYDLKSNVDLVSRKKPNEIRLILEKSNVFIQTSWAEGFSNSTLEAQALGLPVIVTPVSGMSSIVQHKITGYISEDFSPEEVLKGLDWYVGLSPNELKELSNQASKFVQEHFSFGKLKQNWLNFFE